MAFLLKCLLILLQIPQPLSHIHICPKPKVKLSPTETFYPAPPSSLDCNTPDVTFHVCNSNSCHFRLCVMIFPSWSGFVFSFAFLFMSCISYHVIMCISFAYVFVSCIRAFSPLSFCNPTLPHAPVHPSYLLFVCGC